MATLCCDGHARGNLPMHYIEVACNGSENSLASCDKTRGYSYYPYFYCYDAAAVTCYPGEVQCILSILSLSACG